jgi:hypothetical protein
MRRPPVAPVVFAVALTIGLVVPIIAFALFTRATIETDVSAVLRVERIAAARLAAAVVRQHFDAAAAAEVARLAAQPAFVQAASRRDNQALDALLAQFINPYQFPFVGVVGARGEVVAQAPSGDVDPSLASNIAASVSNLSPESSWAYLPRDRRDPLSQAGGAYGRWTAGVIVVPLEIGTERLAVFGMLSNHPFTLTASTLLPTPLPRGHSALVLDASGGFVLLMDALGSIDGAHIHRLNVRRIASSSASAIGVVPTANIRRVTLGASTSQSQGRRR